MEPFSILTNRKRAAIALIHSVVFLLIALRGLASPPMTGLFVAAGRHASTETLAGIYFIVTAVLALLLSLSKCTRERLYFAFCTASAGTGFVRSLFGDAGWHVGPQLRVIFLVCAVATGFAIIRSFPAVELRAESNPDSV